MHFKSSSTPQILIKQFRIWPGIGQKETFNKVNRLSVKAGYIIHPDCCNSYTLRFAEAEAYNPNATFYKAWNQVLNKTRFEILMDQIRHYASTYGTDFHDDAWIPNGERLLLNYNIYQVIMPCTTRELYDKCLGMLQSGIALSDQSRGAYVDYIERCIAGYNYPLDIDSIKNRDAQIQLSVDLHLVPNTADAMIRMLFYMVFNSPTPIMSQQNLRTLYRKKKNGAGIPDLSSLFTTDQEKILASVFHRYKNFLLGFKTPTNRSFINRVGKLAEKYHQPMRPGFWESLTTMPIAELKKRLPEEINSLNDNFKIVRLAEMLMYRRKTNTDSTCRIYKIRNGKVWIDSNSIAAYDPYWNKVWEMLATRLSDNLEAIRLNKEKRAGRKCTYVKFPDRLVLMCPKSERMFIGNIPEGSYYPMSGQNNYFGIYWKNDWGAHDFDLHFVGDNGQLIGWNRDFQTKGIVFSGDMTDADPEASEIMRIKDECPNGTISVHRYCGDEGARFRLFFGQETDSATPKTDHMVEPDTIRMSEMITSDSSAMIVARIIDRKAYFTSLRLGNSRVADYSPSVNLSISNMITSGLMLKLAMLSAGYLEWTPGLRDSMGCTINPDIDLSDPNKDAIISIFTE